MMELFRALGSLAERPGPAHVRIAAALDLPGKPDPAEYTALFGLQLYPYASVYLGTEGMLGGEARDRVAGFWSAIGELPPEEPDHLTVLLAQLATIAEREELVDDRPGKRILRHARAAFFWEHLGSWVFSYLARAVEIAPPFYRAWAETLGNALMAQAETLGPAFEMPMHFRAVPPLPDPASAPPGDVIGALLAPVRSGLILTRGDLARIAADVGAGARMNDRRSALSRMLEEAPAATFAHLAEEARRQASVLAASPAVLGEVRDFWVRRAETTAEALTRWR
jgi:TorA maturation chaperone TorD